RGVVGTDMTPDLAIRVGKAIGAFLGRGTVALARDTRTTGPMLARAVGAGVMSVGCDLVDLGVVPTPAAQFYVAKAGGLRGGVVVTASHNPREYNGIKAIDARGMEMRREDEEAVEALYFGERSTPAVWSDVGTIRSDDGAIPRYLNGILSRLDVDAIRSKKLRVAVDPGNGAGALTTPYLLRSLGCMVLSLNGQPDGAFPGRAPEPIAEHLGDLLRIVRDSRADLGVAHDGDADRAIFVDETGGFVVGDKSLALLAREAVRGRGGVVVTPVSTGNLLDEVVTKEGANVHRTRVGAPIVARTMFETGATFGGEENGGVIFPEHQFCRDGGMAVGKMLELLARAGTTLSALLEGLPAYSMSKASVDVPTERRDAVLASVLSLAAGRRIDTVDGVKVHEADGWVLVRPSGTESVFRIYAEARTPARAEALAREGVDLVRKALKASSGRPP
ncbi:MAG: phosphoglucosamine mutase, partial [Methanobacteriota archaeon]